MSDPADRCPRCGAALAAEQRWCLECGAPARTRLAATPNWRLPVALVALVATLSVLALALAFAELTDDPAGPVPTTEGTQPAPAPPATEPPGG